jgi:hypothetical protein
VVSGRFCEHGESLRSNGTNRSIEAGTSITEPTTDYRLPTTELLLSERQLPGSFEELIDGGLKLSDVDLAPTEPDGQRLERRVGEQFGYARDRRCPAFGPGFVEVDRVVA